MLSHDDNETLVRVGPDTAMGNLFRHYWIPFLPSTDLEIDGQPQTVRLLGETLVAFRDSEGRVGLIDSVCPHRGAPLAFGRNEQCGLRCIYHGWKFNVDGNVVDMLAEPKGSRLKERIHVKHYPCVERNGIAWTYMGLENADQRPPLPNFEWNLVPDENVTVTFRVQECNWLQALEGEIDSAHAPILHGRVDKGGTIDQWVATKDVQPKFENERQDFGMSIAARRTFDENKYYWRVNQFVLPFFTLVPPQTQYPELSGHAWVPIDDEHTLCMMFSYHPSQPLDPRSRDIFHNGYKGRETGHASVNAFDDQGPLVPYGRYVARHRRNNSYHFDYESQRTTWAAGLPGLWVQDAACQSGLTPIYDRSNEHLGSSDTGIAATRRMLLELTRALRDHGTLPSQHDNPDLYMVRAVSITLAKDSPWREEGKVPMTARLGEGFGYAL